LDWRTKLSGFTLAQQERGRIRCPCCETELELTPANFVMQIAFVLGATAAIWPAVDFMRRSEWASLLAGVALAGLIVPATVATYLLLGQWRVKPSKSILAR